MVILRYEFESCDGHSEVDILLQGWAELKSYYEQERQMDKCGMYTHCQVQRH